MIFRVIQVEISIVKFLNYNYLKKTNKDQKSKVKDHLKIMKIVVLMKQVANKDAVLRVGKDEKWIEEADMAYQTNESDGYALEEALRMKEAKGEGEVIVCSLGPQRAKTVIKDALARGANEQRLIGPAAFEAFVEKLEVGQKELPSFGQHEQ